MKTEIFFTYLFLTPSLLFAGQVNSYIPVYGAYPVGVWHMNESGGSRLEDATGHGNTGYFAAGTSPIWVTGKYGSGLNFNSSGFPTCAEIEFQNEGNFDFERTDSFYILLWWNPTLPSQGSHVIGKRASGTAAGYALQQSLLINGDYQWSVQSSNLDSCNQVTNGALNGKYYIPGRYHLFMMYWDGTSNCDDMGLYIDGSTVAMKSNGDGGTTVGGSILNDVAFGIGCIAGQATVGNADEIAVYRGYKGRMTADRARKIYSDFVQGRTSEGR